MLQKDGGNLKDFADESCCQNERKLGGIKSPDEEQNKEEIKGERESVCAWKREREKERETSLGTGFQRNGPIISLVKNANEILDVRKLDNLIRSDATRAEL